MGQYYEEVYRRRLNRYGNDYQQRVQRQRERDFENYLYKTVYLVNFEWDKEFVSASLEPYKQDLTQTQGYLLTKTEIKIPAGAVLSIESQDGTCAPWMVWWLEHVENSGYNRYVVLKLTTEFEIDGERFWAYFKGPGTTAISDTLKSATAQPIYNENNNLYMLIVPRSCPLVKDQYFEIGADGARLGFRVTDLDILSTQGISYISIDPAPLREQTAAPAKTIEDDDQDFFWLSGGKQ